MKKRVLILTMSDKHKNEKEGGYCVSGIDLEEKKLIRLVGVHNHFKITDAEAVYDNGNLCSPFHVIEVEAEHIDNAMVDERNKTGWGIPGLIYPEELLEIQPENHIVSGKFVFVREMYIKEVISTLEEMGLISDEEYIFKDVNTSLTPYNARENGCSLRVVHLDKMDIYKKESTEGGCQRHFRAKFSYKNKWYTDISVTDPEYKAMEAMYTSRPLRNVYIVVSIGPEFKGSHYKIIGKIFTPSLQFQPSPMTLRRIAN